MVKIKDIRDRLQKDPHEYTEIRLIVAKRTLAFWMAFYYLLFLFTIGGFAFGPFSIKTLSLLTYHTYTILIISLAWFLYEFVVYWVHVYFDEDRWIIIVALVISILFAGFTLTTHFI